MSGGKGATFDIERHIRDRFQEPMCRMLARDGATNILVYPEGPSPEQFDKGDLQYEQQGRLVTSDIKGDRDIYPGCTLFYETWSNHPVRKGWGRKKGILRVWYAFYAVGMVVILDLEAWREEAEAWLEQDPRREKSQAKNAQRNLTKGVPCKLRDLLMWDRVRAKDGLPPIVTDICVLEGGEMRSLTPAKGAHLLLARAEDRESWEPWPEEG